GRVRRIHRLRVQSFEPNPVFDAGDFTLPAKPGMRVVVSEPPPRPGSGLNADLPASKTYLLSASGSCEQVSAKGYTTLDGRLRPPERSRAWLWWTTVAAAVGWTALMYFVLRRKRSLALVQRK